MIKLDGKVGKVLTGPPRASLAEAEEDLHALRALLDSMAAPVLTLYLAIHKDDVHFCKTQGHVPLRFVSPGKTTIGLREKIEDAVERYSMAFGPTPREDLVMLRVVFTQLGIAHFATDNCGESYDFQCRLAKKVWRDSVDHGVWFFIGALPLQDAKMMSSVHWSPVE